MLVDKHVREISEINNDELSPIIEKFNLPDNSDKLNLVDAFINKYKFNIFRLKLLSDDEYSTMYNKIIDCLYYVGDLSAPLFNIREDIQNHFHIVHNKTPQLANNLYLDAYSKIHKPYNIYKNRLYNLLGLLEKKYKRINGNHTKLPKI